MAFRDNSVLVRSANKINLVADDGAPTVYDGTAGADAFIVADGAVGDDVISGFLANDSIITGKQIFDGNADGYIAFGDNATLDVDRFGRGDSRAGDDNIRVLGGLEDTILEVRYLGTKDGGFVYADSGTRDALFGRFTKGFTSTNTGGDASITQGLRIDNDVADNTFDFGKGSVALLTDNALGLNFGGDVIDGLGDDDLLVFTSKIFDSTGEDIITFGKNLVLDLSGAKGPLTSDPSKGPGGQIDFTGMTQIYYLGSKSIDGTEYYYYGSSADLAPAGVSIFAGE